MGLFDKILGQAGGKDSLPKDKNGVPYADSSSIADDERPYYQNDEYYSYYSYGNTDADRLITFEERKSKTYPSAGGLYVGEIMLLEYVSYGSYPKPAKGYPGFWWFQYGIRDIGHALESLAQRGFIQWASKANRVDHLTVAELKELLGRFQFQTSGSKAALLTRIHDSIPEDQLPEDMLPPKYELTEAGAKELEENAYIPYMHKSQYKTLEEVGGLNVWSLNNAFKGIMPENWRQIIGAMEKKQFGINACCNVPEKKAAPQPRKVDAGPASASSSAETDEKKASKDDYQPLRFKEIGFRLFYHNFCVFKLNSKNRGIAEGLPNAAEANCVLVYGYIEEKKGLMLEMIAAGKKGTKYYNFFPAVGKHTTIAPAEIENEEIFILDNDGGQLTNRFERKLKVLEKFDAPEELEESRTLGFLDECRDHYHPDIVTVLLLKTGLKTEPCKVRITSAANNTLKGVLMANPRQAFGCRKGDEIPFFPHKNEDDGSIVCLADMGVEESQDTDPSQEQFEDGSALKEAIKRFNAGKNNDTYNYLLWVLSKSRVIIPCDIELSDRAQEIAHELDKTGKSIDSLDEQTRDELFEGMTKIPQILTSNDKAFFPIFSKGESVGDKDAAEVDASFIEAAQLTLANENLFGIVLNAFSDSIIIERDVVESVLNSIGETVPKEEKQESSSSNPEKGSQATKTVGYITGNSDAPIELRIEKMDVFNFSLSENKVAPIRGVQLINKTGKQAYGLKLKVSSDLDFFTPFELSIGKIPADRNVYLEDITLPANGAYLANLTEAITATVTVQLMHGDDLIDQCQDEMRLLAYDQWSGDNYLLPAFIMPNHPAIISLKKEVAAYLEKKGEDFALEGYQGERFREHNENRIRLFMEAAYAVIQEKKIYYSDPPTGFERFQRIRTCDTVLRENLGTCMDMTILYASLLEALDLHPLLFCMDGHIFCGSWLKRSVFPQIIISDLNEIIKRTNHSSAEITFVECTKMCADSDLTFAQAEKIALNQNTPNAKAFECVVDVRAARFRGVRPIPQRIITSKGVSLQRDETDYAKEEQAGQIQVVDLGIDASESKGLTKRDIWESKLLDLSTRNMLLNVPVNASVEPFFSANIDKLEDALADGEEFRLMPMPGWILDIVAQHDGKEYRWIDYAIKKYGIFEIDEWPLDIGDRIRLEYQNHKLYSFCDAKTLDKELAGIYRVARSSQQENGVSSLYLAIGLLRWFEIKDDGSKAEEPCYAPLILIPIEIVRKSANQGYALHMRDEEAHLNSTLVQLLLDSKYNVDISGLEPLPTDNKGVDVKKVFAIIRNAVITLSDWDVVETCVVSNFSFSQFALWNDIHTNPDRLEKSDIVRSLMNGHVDFDCSLPQNIDEEPVYLPITVDSTQLHAIRMAAHGSTFVLHGPPGTGKSQTITGMIANLMASGKKVLFVAEKRVALEVVEKRLVSLGIGNFCMELHSDRASKKQVLSELDKAMKARFRYENDDYKSFSNRVAGTRAELDEYVKSLHKKYKSGYSLHDLIDYYQSVQDADDGIQFSGDEAGELDATTIRGHADKIRSLIAAGKAVEAESFEVLGEARFTGYTLDKRLQVIKAAKEYASTLDSVQKSSGNFADRIGIAKPQNYQDLEALEKIALTIQRIRDRDPIDEILKSVGVKGTSKFFLAKKKAQEVKEKLLTRWKPEIFEADIAAINAQYEAASRKFFGRTSAINDVLNKIQRYSQEPMTADDIPSALQALLAFKEKEKVATKEYDSLSSEEKEVVERFATKDDADIALKNATEMDQLAETVPGGQGIVNQFVQNKTNLLSVESFLADLGKLRTTANAINRLLERVAGTTRQDWFEREHHLCSYLISNPTELKEWALYNQIRSACEEAGLKPVIEAYENGMEESKIIPAYRKGLDYALINKIIYNDPVLGNFSGATFNDTIRRFKRLDMELLHVTQEEIKRMLGNNAPFDDESPIISHELAILRKAIQGGGRGLTIRSLFSMIPNILQRLCPCMLMNPDSVAQYLTDEVPQFDVVIFDEASQLPTCKAVGALSRAKHAVIVGDPKQMPPTSVGVKKTTVTDDFTLEDLDSILDDALALGIPSLHLQWHYRSTHESLIAFSNSQFYENKMYTFPSANDREQHVRIVYVDGVYDKNINKAEAEAIADEVVRRYHDPILRSQSIGIVTFNQKQMKLIEKLLEVRFAHDPGLDAWANKEEDGIFVKNLENVQGDERDAILFSVTYGPDPKGHVSMNFGPINQDGGWKRLNVAFSRARISMTLFSSLHPEMIDLSKSSAEGVEALKGFLKFAETSGMSSYHPTSENGKRKGTLKAICDVLTDAGYSVETMVGHSDFHVDIAVIDPYDSSRYILGVLLDGDGYKLTANTRDREVAQIGVLNHLGWTIHRIWSIDWWDNRKKETSKLLKLLDSLKESAKDEAEKKAVAQEEQKQAALKADTISEQQRKEELEIMNEEDDDAPKKPLDIDVVALNEHEPDQVLEDDNNASQPETLTESAHQESEVDNAPGKSTPALETVSEPRTYEFAELPDSKLSQAEFVSSANRAEIGKRALLLVEKEGPILKETLIKRILSSFGIIRTNASLEALEKALKSVKIKNSKVKGVVFCWAPDQDPKEYMGIRVSSERSSDEISPQEIKNAACYVLQQSGPMEKNDLVKAISSLLGYKRLGKNLVLAITDALPYAKNNGFIAIEAGKYRLAQQDNTGTQDKSSVVPANGNVIELHLTSNGITAHAVYSEGSFVVLKGSQMNPDTRPSCHESILNLRNELISSGKVKDYVFEEDVPFNSPSAAAGAVVGGNMNGWVSWINNEGKTLKEVTGRV